MKGSQIWMAFRRFIWEDMVIEQLILIQGRFEIEDEVEDNGDMLSVLKNLRLLFIELAHNGRKESSERMISSVLESFIKLKVLWNIQLKLPRQLDMWSGIQD